MAKSITQEFVKGLWTDIPPFRYVLGLCPVLGVTTTMENGVGMGLATTFVLVCSNILVSLLRKIIPKKVRIACFIIIIATFVIIVEFAMQAYAYPLFLKLGVFIPLIVVTVLFWVVQMDLHPKTAFSLQLPTALAWVSDSPFRLLRSVLCGKCSGAVH